MSSKTIIGIIVVIIIAAIAYFMLMPKEAAAPGPEAGATSTATTTGSEDTGGIGATVGASIGSAPMSATVTYDGTAFTPSTVTIAKGGTVTFVNNSTGEMWVAADEHPTHTEYDGTSRSEHCPNTGNTAFDQCARSTADYSFTFQKTGSWEYHDHINSSAQGFVVVK